LPFLYEPMIWEEAIPQSRAPPQNIPAVEKLSPSPFGLWDLVPYAIAFFAGLFIGLPIGREAIKVTMGITEAEVRRKLEEVKAKRGLR